MFSQKIKCTLACTILLCCLKYTLSISTINDEMDDYRSNQLEDSLIRLLSLLDVSTNSVDSLRRFSYLYGQNQLQDSGTYPDSTWRDRIINDIPDKRTPKHLKGGFIPIRGKRSTLDSFDKRTNDIFHRMQQQLKESSIEGSVDTPHDLRRSTEVYTDGGISVQQPALSQGEEMDTDGALNVPLKRGYSRRWYAINNMPGTVLYLPVHRTRNRPTAGRQAPNKEVNNIKRHLAASAFIPNRG